MATILKRGLKNGRPRYDAQIRRRGVLKKKSFGTRAAAERWARKVEAALDDGAQLPSTRAERRTLAEVLKAYEDEALGALRDAAGRRRHLEWWRSRLGAAPARSLSRADVRDAMAALEAGDTPTGQPAAPSTRRRYLSALRSALSWAVDREYLDANPAARAARPGLDVEPPGRVRFLDDAERKALLDACEASTEKRLAPLVRLALLTGARQGELIGLTWDRVDLHRGLLSLAETKAGRPRSVALSKAAGAVLRDLWARRGVSPYVFASRRLPVERKPRFVRTAWATAVEAAGLADFRFHDLRHSFASYCLSAGATLPELAAALGHSTIAMVSRYSHLEKPHAAQLAERVAARVQIPAPSSAANAGKPEQVQLLGAEQAREPVATAAELGA